MLYPRATKSRELYDLSGIWHFQPDAEEKGEQERWFETGLPDPILMPVPASYNDITQEESIRDLVGDVWYETEVVVPRSWKDRRIVLRFGSVTHWGKVWINGLFLMEHKGGYLPFEREIGDLVRAGERIRITVKVSNLLDWQTLPPGEVVWLEDPHRNEKPKRFQKYFHDFFNYAGIHRKVFLYATPGRYIEDITVRTDVDGGEGIVRYQVVSRGEGSVHVKLLDRQGEVAAAGEGAAGELRVKDPRLWQPGQPYLYRLVVVLGEGEQQDEYSLKVGIRTVCVRDGQFLINGKPFYFKGFGKHEDMDLKGKGYDDVLWVKDFNLMQWIHANSFRTSHYPYAEEVLDLADEYGMVVIDESPAVGMTFFKEKRDAFVPERINDQTQAYHKEVMRDLIARDKNHPSVVMWSIANEPSSWEERAADYFRGIIDVTRESDPTRPVTMVSYAFPFGPRKDKVAPMLDVVCINKYYSWYEDSGQLDIIEFQARTELTAWYQEFGKPIIITEYGADTIPGFHADPPVMFTEEYQIEMIRHFNHVFDQLDFVIGEHIWAFSDFATKQGTTRIIGNRKGVFTRQRAPKSVAFYLRDRWAKR